MHKGFVLRLALVQKLHSPSLIYIYLSLSLPTPLINSLRRWLMWSIFRAVIGELSVCVVDERRQNRKGIILILGGCPRPWGLQSSSKHEAKPPFFKVCFAARWYTYPPY